MNIIDKSTFGHTPHKSPISSLHKFNHAIYIYKKQIKFTFRKFSFEITNIISLSSTTLEG